MSGVPLVSSAFLLLAVLLLHDVCTAWWAGAALFVIDLGVLATRATRADRHRCPCCRRRTLDRRGVHDICDVCFWQDDGQDDHNADKVRGGPNGSLSLTQARVNYLRIGACDEAALGSVRPPRDGEE